MEEKRPWYLSESFFIVLFFVLPPVALVYFFIIRNKVSVKFEMFMAALLTILWAFRLFVPLTPIQTYIGTALIILAPFTFILITRTNRDDEKQA